MAQIRPGQIGPIEVRSVQNCISEVCVLELRRHKMCAIEVSVSEVHGV